MHTAATSRVQTHTKINGFTLIELMVAMVIGMVVIGAAISMFRTTISHQRSIRFTSQLQEESFFLSHVLRQQIAQIGYRPIDDLKVDGRIMPIDDRQTAFPEVPNSWEQGQTIKVVGNSFFYRYYGASNEMDTVDFSVFDCLGNPVAEGSVRENAISLKNNQVVCTVETNSAVIAGADEGVLIEKIVYELGIDDDGDRKIDRNIDTATATNTDFINAKQLIVRLLFSTPNGVAVQKQPYMFNGAQFDSTDRKLRLESEVSMALRN